MTYQFKNIGLITKSDDSRVLTTLTAITRHLDSCKKNIYLHRSAKEFSLNKNYNTVSHQQLAEHCDLIICIGGDGTLLATARTFANHRIPILGINLGRLGFLVDISPNEISERLDEIFAGQFIKDERYLFDVQIIRNQQTISNHVALNDVVIHKWNIARMIELETYINGQFLNRQHADGLIVSTPTGSTAYALSSGGPILHPSLNAILLSPICPHTLSNRPIVVDAECCIEIYLKGREPNAKVTLDGQSSQDLFINDTIKITQKPEKVVILHPKNHDYFDILRAKLHWSEHPRK